MAARKRTRHQIRRDRLEVAKLYLRGWQQVEIGDKLGLSQQQISYDLKQIHKEWAESRIESYDLIVNQQLARIDQAESEAWKVWQRALDDPDTYSATHWWDRIVHCVEMRNKILGLDVTKVSVTDPTGQRESIHAGLTETERAEKLDALIDTLVQQRIDGEE